MKHIGRHAVVIGASMGGLLAARVLADYYDVVTLTVAANEAMVLQACLAQGAPIWRSASSAR